MKITEENVLEITKEFEKSHYQYIAEHHIIRPYIADLDIIRQDDVYILDMSYDFFSTDAKQEALEKNMLLITGLEFGTGYESEMNEDIMTVGSTTLWTTVTDPTLYDEVFNLCNRISDACHEFLIEMSNDASSMLPNIHDWIAQQIAENMITEPGDKKLEVIRRDANARLQELYRYLTPDYIYVTCINSNIQNYYENADDPEHAYRINRFYDIYQEIMKPMYEELRQFLVHRIWKYNIFPGSREKILDVFRKRQHLYAYIPFGKNQPFEKATQLMEQGKFLHPYAVYFIK